MRFTVAMTVFGVAAAIAVGWLFASVATPAPVKPPTRLVNCQTRACVPAVIRKVFGAHAGRALRVARCESRLWPHARGSAGERGIFQIHPVHFGWLDEGRLWQPWYNAKIAWRLSRGGTSWGPWTCA